MIYLEIFTELTRAMIDLNSKQKVEIHLDSDMKSHPRCEHGPTILFSR